MTGPEEGTGREPLAAADALCRALEGLGTRHVFGLPGTQNLAVTEALRRSELGWIVPSNELAAAFAAVGYYRASGRPGVCLTIPGPGFTWALTGMAEARLDSAAVLWITGDHPRGGRPRRRLQEIPQARMAAPVVKQTLRVSAAAELADTLRRAHGAARAGEPGPVLVEVEHPVWEESCAALDLPAPDSVPADIEPADPAAVEAVARRLAAARRPLLFVGQGCQGGAGALRRLAEALDAPVLVGTSGRGAIPDGHRLAVTLDRAEDAAGLARRLIGGSDLVLVLGSGLSHNATVGFEVDLPLEKLVRVDASEEALADDAHPASEAVRADVPGLMEALLEREDAWRIGEERWPEAAPISDRRGTGESGGGAEDEPRLAGGGSMADLFGALRETLPTDAPLATDSGLHQMLARRHFRVDAPRTLVTPTDFQSMGFGLPAAIGAALARPGTPVVAVVGDGGLRLSAFELATARALELDLTVLVFVDGYFGLIRRGQISAYGRGSGVELPAVDLEPLALSLGVEHHRIGGDPGPTLADCLERGGVHLVEAPLDDPSGLWREAADARLREEVRRRLGPERMERLRRWRERWRSRGERDPGG